MLKISSFFSSEDTLGEKTIYKWENRFAIHPPDKEFLLEYTKIPISLYEITDHQCKSWQKN